MRTGSSEARTRCRRRRWARGGPRRRRCFDAAERLLRCVEGSLKSTESEHVKKRTSFNNNDTFLDRDKDGRIDGLFCEVEKYDRGSGVTAKAVVTVDA